MKLNDKKENQLNKEDKRKKIKTKIKSNAVFVLLTILSPIILIVLPISLLVDKIKKQK